MRSNSTPKIPETPSLKRIGYGTDNFIKVEHHQTSRPSTNQGSDGYIDRHGIYKKVIFKVNNRGDNHFSMTGDSKKGLVLDQPKCEFSNQIGPPRNSTGERSFHEVNHRRRSRYKFTNLSGSLTEISTGWYTIFVRNVEDDDEVLKTIQSYITPVAFYPYNKQYFDSTLRFLVDSYDVAKVLQDTSYKIIQRDDLKITIKVSAYLPLYGLISFTPVSSEVREKMIEAMATRYNRSNKSFDLSKFHACPLFTNNQLFVPLNQPAVLLAALNMVAQYTKHDLYSLSLENNHIYLVEGLNCLRWLFPELKVLNLAGNKLSHVKELKFLSGYTIEELNLSRNPVCDRNNKEHYRQDIEQLFPILNKLDDSELQPRYCSIISKFKIPINLGNCYPIPRDHNPELPNPVMTLVESFLTQYYEKYDNQVSRQMVTECYCENATFTLSSSFLSKKNNDTNRGNLLNYLPKSRNFLNSDQNKEIRHNLLHRGRENIIQFLDMLPKTKHDIGSFMVDVPSVTNTIIQIVVNGVFAENFKETNYRHICRSFCRTFCAVPFGSSLSIISDMLFITTVTNDLLVETSKRFYVFKPKPVLFKQIQPNQPMVQQSTASFSMFNTTSVLQTEFPTYDQLVAEAPVNLIKDANENRNKSTMVKKEFIKKERMDK